MKSKNKTEEKNILEILSSFGEVKIIDGKNVLIFTDKNGIEVYLRYSIGNTFSFIKGADPQKIQLRKFFEPNLTIFSQKLTNIIDLEISSGFPVKNILLGNEYLVSLKKILDEAKIETEYKPNRLVYTSTDFKVSINLDKTVSYNFTSDFLNNKTDIKKTRKSIEALENFLLDLKDKIM